MKMANLVKLAIVFAALLCVGAMWPVPLKTEIARRELKDGKLVLTFRTGTEYLLRWPLGHEAASVKVWEEVYCASNGVVVKQ